MKDYLIFMLFPVFAGTIVSFVSFLFGGSALMQGAIIGIFFGLGLICTIIIRFQKIEPKQKKKLLWIFVNIINK